MTLIKTIISILLIPIVIGFAFNLTDINFSNTPEYLLYGLIFGLIINIIFIHLLSSNRLNLLFTLEHEYTHAIFALNPKEISATSEGRGNCYGHHTFLSSIAPYFIPLFTLITLVILRLVSQQNQIYFQFLIGFFYINFQLENLYQIFIIKTDDIFREGFSLINLILIILGNIILVGIIFLTLTYDSPLEFIKHGFIHSAEVYETILKFIQAILLKAGGM